MGSIKGQKHNPYIEGKYGHLNPNDVVFTPDWLAKQIVDMFPIEGKVLEPCKGEGAFLQYLPDDADWCEIAEGKNYYELGFSSICNTENEVIEGCGYEVNEITFEELLERVKGVFEIIKVEGSVEFLTD